MLLTLFSASAPLIASVSGTAAASAQLSTSIRLAASAPCLASSSAALFTRSPLPAASGLVQAFAGGSLTDPPRFVAATTTLAQGTGAISVAPPTGIANGDLLLLCVETSNEVVATPSGWTLLAPTPLGSGTAGDNAAVRLTVFWKVTTGTETNVSLADSGNHTSGAILAFRGVFQTPFGQFTGTVNTGVASSTVQWASFNAEFAGSYIVAIAAVSIDGATSNTSTVAAQSNYTASRLFDQTNNAGGGGGIVAFGGQRYLPGTVNALTATVSAAERYASLHLALRSPPSQALLNGSAVATASAVSEIQRDTLLNASPRVESTAVGQLSTAIFMAGAAFASTSVTESATFRITFDSSVQALAYVAPAAIQTAIFMVASPTAQTNTVLAMLNTGIPVVAATTALATVQAAITTQIRANAAVSVLATSGAALATQIRLFTSAAGEASASSSLRIGMLFSAAAASLASVSATLTNSSAQLSSSATAQANVSAALSTAIPLAASAPVVASVAGALNASIRLAAAPQVQASAGASLTTAISLAASPTAQANQVLAMLNTGIVLAGASFGSSLSAGALTNGIRLNVAASVLVSGTGSLSTAIRLAGSGAGLASTSVSLNTRIELEVVYLLASTVVTANLTVGPRFSGLAASEAYATADLYVDLTKPSLDISAPGWTASTGSLLYDMVDDPVAAINDSDFITSPALTASPQPVVFATSSELIPENYVVRVRAKRRGAGGEIRASLLDISGQPVGSSSWQSLTNTFQTYSLAVSTAVTSARVQIEVR